MRNLFIKALSKKAKINKNIILLSGDLGYKYFDQFNRSFPNRFINTGIAENNMVNLACGLALMGKEVYIYSIIPFLTFRSLEQIRNNIANLNLNIKIIGSGGGFSYGNQGISHNPIEDISVIRSIPNIDIYNPGFEEEGKIAFKYLFNSKRPSYLRLGKKANVEIKNKLINQQKKGEGLEIIKGKDILIFSTGNIIEEVLSSIKWLNKIKIYPTVISCYCLKPINVSYYKNTIKKYNNVITIEENNEIGGLNSIISEIIAQSKDLNPNFHSIALKDKTHLTIGSQQYLRKLNQIDSENIFKKIKRIIKNI